MKYKNVEEKLTAYALGELDELEVADVETLIANDDEAKQYVEDIRAIGGIAEEAFAGESLDEARHNAIFAAAGNATSRANSTAFLSARMSWGQWGAIAASIAVLAGLVFVSAPGKKNAPNGSIIARTEVELLRSQLKVRQERTGESINERFGAEAQTAATPSSAEVGKDAMVNELMQEADFYSDNRKYRVASELYDEALAIDSDNEDARRKLAEATVAARTEEVEEVARDLTVQTQFIRRGIEQDKLLPEAAATALSPTQFEITNANTLVAVDPEERQAVRPSIDGENALVDSLTSAKPAGATVVAGAKPSQATSDNLDGMKQDTRSRSGGLQNVQVGGEIRIRANYFGPAEAGQGESAGGFGGGEFDPNTIQGGEQPTQLATGADFNAPQSGLDVAMNGAYVVEDDKVWAEQLDTLDSLPQVQMGLQLARVGNFALVTPPQQQAPPNTEAYDRVVDNPFKRAIDEPLSTFSIDVDTGSYPNVRRFLRDGQLPPKDAVRIEELLNYFNYTYAPPANDEPFAAHVELVECPWNAEHHLMRIGLKGREVEVHTRPKANLVFLLDVSGSMQPENKLPLVRDAMQLLTKQLRPDDRVAIVTYAGASGLALPSTPGTDQTTILNAIRQLQSGGSTNGAAGIELAYQVAQENFVDGGVNRVILATDGDFNVGVTDRGSLDRLIEDKAKSGVFLTVLGVGEGNLKDATMEQLADKGNGQYAYLDTEREARKVLVEQVGGTLVTIAKDVKVQIDFNPMVVGEYRLIGYENRVLAAQDFDDDTKDAGEIGAGHTVTALYEITPPTATDYPEASGTQSRYISRVPAGPNTTSQLPDGTVVPQLLTVKLRHKLPESDTSTLLEIPITAEPKRIADTSQDVRFAASVAAFGMALRESPYRGTTNWDLIANLAEDGIGDDPQGYRAEFMDMIRIARGLKPAIELQISAAAATNQAEPILVSIRKWTGGRYVAEIRTQTERAKYFGVGEGFESFKVISIDPAAQKVVIYSEEHRRERTLRPVAEGSEFGVELVRLTPSTGGKYLLELKIGDSEPTQYSQDGLPDGYRFISVDSRTGETLLHSANHGKNFILIPTN